MKKCSKCGVEKPDTTDYFYKQTKPRKGLNPQCKACMKAYKKKWHNKNKQRINEKTKKWRDKNKRHIANYCKKKYDTDVHYRLTANVRCLIYMSLRGIESEGKLKYVPWTIDELKEHLETLFVDGMSWDNRTEWHIDHIQPVSSFNYESPEDEEFQKCWALKNLQPLWASDNIRKGDKIV